MDLNFACSIFFEHKGVFDRWKTQQNILLFFLLSPFYLELHDISLLPLHLLVPFLSPNDTIFNSSQSNLAAPGIQTWVLERTQLFVK